LARAKFTLTMNSLSRREEDTLLKTTKAFALKQCDSLLKGLYGRVFAASSR